MVRLTRAQSIIVGVGALVLFFVIGGVLVQDGNKVIPTLSNDERAALSLKDAPSSDGAKEQSLFVLDNFERSEIKDGRKTWEVKAREGHYAPGSSSALVRDATLWVYEKDGGIVKLLAKEANLFFDGTALTKAAATGGVTLIKNDELTLTTDQAVYDKVANTVHAPGHVHIVSKSMDVEGVGMNVDVGKQEIVLLGDVSTVVKPKVESSEEGER